MRQQGGQQEWRRSTAGAGRHDPSRGPTEPSPLRPSQSWIPPTIMALVCENPRMNWAGAYLMERRIRRSMISYTPARRASFSTRITGPSSGSTHGHPLVAASGSVAARKTAPAIRGTGVIGRPASKILTGRPRIAVSFFLKNRNVSARRGHRDGEGWKER